MQQLRFVRSESQVRIQPAWRTPELAGLDSDVGQAGLAWSVLPRMGAIQLTLLLRDLTSGSDARRQLRDALGDLGQTGLYRLTEHQVLSMVVAMVAAGRLTVMEKMRREVKTHQMRKVGGGPRHAQSEAASTPSQMSNRTGELASASPLSPLPEVLAHIDQDAQAATLKAAAQRGVPFCEECAKARPGHGGNPASSTRLAA